ncbi:pyridoxamine 5'-phosphate oxidase family protein [Chitinophaga horti]|uniref:Pyridoxamine 5'-phosphate oxidase family protein n=1 Tax=Chitinophaga horti TaxID=2920382 RepID=A0ABY6J8E2_9BACT|nr:pyridoxamine 5'-phosphate oxidase family protein [Chitinophaga horti]UYQ94577.1 pyridoxamine 5'-phosphate oxidase family protein [Chitinophaga horti]
MNDTKNLAGTEAIAKLKELVDAANICIFVTNLAETPLSSRPMSTMKVDDDGCLWFFSKENTEKEHEIKNDNRVQLFYSNKNSSEYLSVYGEAELLKDRQKVEELWTPIAKAWFTEGKDDPTIEIIKVTPRDAYYWDTKNNKAVSLLKIAVGAVTGRRMDDGVQGKLTV